MNRRGFTLVELVVALLLAGIVSTAAYRLLLTGQRVYQRQSEQVGVNASVREAVAILVGDLRELNAGDPLGSDIIAMSGSSVTYKAPRNLFFLCRSPNVNNRTLTLGTTVAFGFIRLTAGRDSVLIFAENDSTTRADDSWLHAAVTAVSQGSDCPSNAASTSVTLAGVTRKQLNGVQRGAPVRGFEVVEMLLHGEAAGSWWLGIRSWAGSGWESVQPVLGPLAADGLRLTYHDSSGAETTDPARVARIGLAVVGQTARPVMTGSGSLGYDTTDLSTQVTLRNNRRN